MEMLNVNSGEHISRVYICDGPDSSGSNAANRPGLSPHETGETLHSFSDRPASCSPDNVQVHAGIPQKIVVEKDSKADIVILIMSGVSCDVKLDVTLKGEGAEANIFGAYLCGAEERVKLFNEELGY